MKHYYARKKRKEIPGLENLEPFRFDLPMELHNLALQFCQKLLNGFVAQVVTVGHREVSASLHPDDAALVEDLIKALVAARSAPR